MTVAFGHFGTPYGSHLGRLGFTLWSVWMYEGDFRSHLEYFGTTLEHLGHTFWTVWDHFGITWGIGCDFGSLCNHSGIILGSLLAHDGDFGITWGAF